MIGLFLATMAVASSYPAPIAPAAEGKVMCFRPDETRKTCASTGAYSDNGDGTFTNLATMLLPGQPVMVLQAKTVVTIRDGYVCGAMHTENVTSGLLWVDGQLLSSAEARPTLDRLVATMFSGILDKEICTTYVPIDNQLMSKASLDGKSFGVDSAVKWIGTSEDYKVAP